MAMDCWGWRTWRDEGGLSGTRTSETGHLGGLKTSITGSNTNTNTCLSTSIIKFKFHDFLRIFKDVQTLSTFGRALIIVLQPLSWCDLLEKAVTDLWCWWQGQLSTSRQYQAQTVTLTLLILLVSAGIHTLLPSSSIGGRHCGRPGPPQTMHSGAGRWRPWSGPLQRPLRGIRWGRRWAGSWLSRERRQSSIHPPPANLPLHLVAKLYTNCRIVQL